jgi:hypothetical protein
MRGGSEVKQEVKALRSHQGPSLHRAGEQHSLWDNCAPSLSLSTPSERLADSRRSPKHASFRLQRPQPCLMTISSFWQEKKERVVCTCHHMELPLNCIRTCGQKCGHQRGHFASFTTGSIILKRPPGPARDNTPRAHLATKK